MAHADAHDVHPLSPLQEGIVCRLVPGEQDDRYLLSTLFELRSHTLLRPLIEALDRLIDRHEILRSAIVWKQRPVQVVCAEAALPVEKVVLDAGRDPLEQWRDRMRSGTGGLDLTKAPLMRLEVAAEAHTGKWYALLHVHCIVCDRLSMDRLIAETMSLLDGKSSLPATVGYRSYVRSTRERARARLSEAFFRDKLKGIDETTQPFGVSGVHEAARPTEEACTALAPALTKRIRAQAKSYGSGAATLFHAAWALVIARASGRDDVVFGTVLSVADGRRAREQPTVGLFVNTLPVRLKLADLTVAELLELVDRELAEISTHVEARPVWVERLGAGVGGNPVYIAALDYRGSAGGGSAEPGSRYAVPGVRVVASRDARVDPLSLVVDDRGDIFSLRVHAPSSVDPQRVIGYVLTAIEAIVSSAESAPRTRALQLSVLPQPEWNEVVRSFNATCTDYPREKLIHELFEEQVARTPDAMAVVCGKQSLTYDLLNREANQVARHLRRKGVGPDSLVALCVRRSIDMLVGMLGVLKAGGAYVPLDPANPSERLRHVLADAAPRVVLTHDEIGDSLPRSGAETVRLDNDQEQIACESEENLDARSMQLSPRNLAYVVYTSGSTGRPKGVAVEHRNIVNYAVHALRQFDVVAGSGSLICTSVSFDLMLTGLYPPLLCGRAVRLCPERHGVPELEQELLRCRDLAPLKITPSHLSLVERALKSGQLDGRVRVLVFGGEPLHAQTVQLWRQHSPRTRIFNHYGPTEATVGCIVNDIGERVAGAVPIGKPIANTQIYVLDGELRPVPIGVAGDIYVGGAGVARGYLRRPELTRERFVSDPFSSDPQARLYKTGDVGRWRSDGMVEYLGRRDDQVKVRGFRIELGEIEAQLMQHARVSRAAVVAIEDAAGEKRLVAYVAAGCRSEHADDAARECFREQLAMQLREHLKAQLPDYMLPSSWVVVEQLPLTSNGKVDRRALASEGRVIREAGGRPNASEPNS